MPRLISQNSSSLHEISTKDANSAHFFDIVQAKFYLPSLIPFWNYLPLLKAVQKPAAQLE